MPAKAGIINENASGFGRNSATIINSKLRVDRIYRDKHDEKKKVKSV